MDACYYSIIERGEDGHFWGWVPDLPGVSADPKTEKEVADRLALQNVERLDFYLTKKSL